MTVFNARALATLTIVALTMNAFDAEGQTIREFSLPADSDLTQIVAGPDGNFWFTEQMANRIGIISPDGSSLIERPLPTPNAGVDGITLGPDGNLWFVETTAMQIGRMKLDGSVVEFPTRCSPSGFIISGPNENVWFPERCSATNQDFIGEVSTEKFAGGIFEHYIGFGKEIRDLVWAPNGDVWFTEFYTNALGELTDSGGLIESSIPTGRNIGRITVGADNNIWFPENTAPTKLARSTLTGSILEFAWPEEHSLLNSITTDSDGNLWLTDTSDCAIWRVTPSEASILPYKIPLPLGSLPASVTRGSEYQIWFVDTTGNKIDVVYTDGIFRAGFESD